MVAKKGSTAVPEVDEDKGYTGPDPVPLAEAAQNALADMVGGEGAQPALDGMENVTKVRFQGMAFDSVEDTIGLGDEVTFLVRARCKAEEKDQLEDGLIRNIRKMKVMSVVVYDPNRP